MKYHLIGNLGVSMQAIAEILKSRGDKVTGSDLKTSGHGAKNITKDIDFVIRSSAVSPGSAGWIEVEEAERLKIKVLKRSEFLGELTAGKYLIAISGMHGKTTVTALIGLALIEAGLDPTVLVGEKLLEFNNSAVREGKSKYFVLEACEYDRSFLDLTPNVAVITNIDLEHLDTYPGGMKEIKKTFVEFLAKIKKGGALVAYSQDKNLKQVAALVRPDIKKIFYGEADHVGADYPSALIGQHNRQNAEAVFALADYLKIDKKHVLEVLKNFKGAKRRLEYKGNFDQTPVFDDYGHHPTEIATTIKALKEKFPERKIIAVFWPHQFKRILPLKDEFVAALSMADEIVLKPIFFVPGRDEKLDVSSEDIALALNKINKKSRVFKQDSEIVDYLKRQNRDGLVILTIGIPPIYKVAELLLKEGT